MRLRITGYYQGEYFYSMSREGLIRAANTRRKKPYIKKGTLILGSGQKTQKGGFLPLLLRFSPLALGRAVLNELPSLYSKGTSKIKNKKQKRILQSDVANSLLDMGTEYCRQKLE